MKQWLSSLRSSLLALTSVPRTRPNTQRRWADLPEDGLGDPCYVTRERHDVASGASAAIADLPASWRSRPPALRMLGRPALRKVSCTYPLNFAATAPPNRPSRTKATRVSTTAGKLVEPSPQESSWYVLRLHLLHPSLPCTDEVDPPPSSCTLRLLRHAPGRTQQCSTDWPGAG